MYVEAHNVTPNFAGRQRITAADLARIGDPCVIFEGTWLDSDGARVWAYSIGGWLDGRPLGDMRGGVTVGGDVALVHADSRQDADALASLGLQDTIEAAKREAESYIDAQAALARLEHVGPIRRIDLATAPASDMSSDFVEDTQAIRKLRGDDIILSAGGIADGA